jgi:hypothetical protein
LLVCSPATVAAVRVRPPPAFSARIVWPERSWKVTTPVVVSISTSSAVVLTVMVLPAVVESKGVDAEQLRAAVASVVRVKNEGSVAYIT